MAERSPAVKTAVELDFLQFNDLACETVGGKVNNSGEEKAKLHID